MTAEPGLEIELAFSLTDEAARRLLAEPVHRASPIDMSAVYFDTPDLALREAGYALRVRREGERWVQTLKSGSAGGLVRGEFERPLNQGILDLSLLATAGLPRKLLARLSDLRPVFETHVRRRQKLVTFGEAEIEVALDEGEVVARPSLS
jgi:triphosphatase